MSNFFEDAQKKREFEQAKVKKACGVKGVVASKRKIRVDITVPEATKDKLMAYAEREGLSASVVVQMLIDKHCK